MTRSMREGSITEEAVRAMAEHGGNLSAARRAFPTAPEPWLDLSTGVNPYAYPLPGLPTEVFRRLPEPSALSLLEEAARRAYRVPGPCHVVAVPGTQSLISLLPFLFRAQRAGILGLTYREHERAWRAGGAEVIQLKALDAAESMDAAIIVNPNNPDGRLIPAEDLQALAQRLGRQGGLLIVDEAFVDLLEPAASLVPVMADEGTLVLRSFGKAFGLPGLRLGFAITSSDIAARLRMALGPWPVSGAAIAIGSAALADEPWLAAVREKLCFDAAALDRCLLAAGLVPRGKTPLFRLVEHPLAPRLFAALGRTGILVRRFDERLDWLRFAIPNNENDRARLRAALTLS